jgi:hypothetical protein
MKPRQDTSYKVKGMRGLAPWCVSCFQHRSSDIVDLSKNPICKHLTVTNKNTWPESWHITTSRRLCAHLSTSGLQKMWNLKIQYLEILTRRKGRESDDSLSFLLIELAAAVFSSRPNAALLPVVFTAASFLVVPTLLYFQSSSLLLLSCSSSLALTWYNS